MSVPSLASRREAYLRRAGSQKADEDKKEKEEKLRQEQLALGLTAGTLWILATAKHFINAFCTDESFSIVSALVKYNVPLFSSLPVF